MVTASQSSRHPVRLESRGDSAPPHGSILIGLRVALHRGPRNSGDALDPARVIEIAPTVVRLERRPVARS